MVARGRRLGGRAPGRVPGPRGRAAGHDGHEVEVLLRAEGWQVEVSHAPSGEFAREHVQAADEEEAKARAADLLRSFRTRSVE